MDQLEPRTDLWGPQRPLKKGQASNANRRRRLKVVAAQSTQKLESGVTQKLRILRRICRG